MNRKLVWAIISVLVLMSMLDIVAKVHRVEASGTIKAGDWITYEVTITDKLPGEIVPTWVKLEFLSVEVTNATVRATMHLSDGTERINTTTVDVVSGADTGFVIPSNSKTGDSVYISEHGNITIDGETTSTYTGVYRTVVYASFSDSGNYFAYYWDKQIGILLEQRNTTSDSTTIYKVKDTNMWQTQLPNPPLDPTVYYIMIIAALAIVVAVAFLRTRKKKPRRRRARRKQR
jgi:hypothetical protein